MLKLGIIGYPISHTLSPQMHTAALQYLNINGIYRAYEVKEDELIQMFNQLKDSGIKGFNVTIPHKISIISLLDELTETAKLIGSVNTVTITKEGKAIGENTDIIGFWETIPNDIKQNLPNLKATIIGCGGSALAVTVALLMNKVKHLKILGRNTAKLSLLKDFIDSRKTLLQSDTIIEKGLMDRVDLSETNILINTTPVGMYPKVDFSPVTKEEILQLPKDALIYDLIYNPQETLLLTLGKYLDRRTINGVEMLIRQGAASLGIWLEQKVAPHGAMRLAVLQNTITVTNAESND